eukprot:631378-Amphidinium_carterae.3
MELWCAMRSPSMSSKGVLIWFEFIDTPGLSPHIGCQLKEKGQRTASMHYEVHFSPFCASQ